MKIRSFIAINLPESLKQELSFLIKKLKEKNPSPYIKWVNPEGIHLTLHFLGYLDEKKIEEVKKIIQKEIVNLKPSKIELKDFGGFPNFWQPKVLFIGGKEIDEKKPLEKFQMELGKELERKGIKIDKRPWQIHFTLARLKKSLKIIIPKFSFNNLQFTVNSIDLMRSDLTPLGAQYIILEKFPLSNL